jgi:DNA-binding response OmpR family regulator
MVVEDDPNVVTLLRQVLADQGMITVHAPDPESGWSTLMAEDPDAAILDVWLYGKEAGWDLLNRIRASEFSDLPVVILTGDNGPNTVERARAASAEYLQKPFTPAALVDRLRRAIRTAGRSPGVRSLPVLILTPSFRIEANLHVPEELPRFSDAWEALVGDTRAYVPVTKARVQTHDGMRDIADSDLLEIRKAEITAIFPLEGE